MNTHLTPLIHMRICIGMNTMFHIRTAILGVSQAQMAEIAGVAQPTVSRWETGELSPGLDEMARIRAYAKAHKIKWTDRLFFELPTPKGAAA